MKRIILALILSMIVFPLHAAITELDLESPGDKLTTLDTDTDLLWLDLTVTEGLAMSDPIVVSLLNAGWQHATSAEVIQLWSHFGVTHRNAPQADYGELAAVDHMLSVMGHTFDGTLSGGGGVSEIRGSHAWTVGGWGANVTIWTEPGVCCQEVWTYANVTNSRGGNADPDFANYLVRQMAPINVPQGTVQECQNFGGNNVLLQAAFMTDPSDPVLTYEWYLDDNLVGVGIEIMPFVELGNHDVRLVITTQSGEEWLGFQDIKIVDTQAPLVEVRFLDGKGNPITTITRSGLNFIEFDVTASDLCDASPAVEAFGGVELIDGQMMRIQASTEAIILQSSLLEVSVSVEDESGNRVVQEDTLAVVD